MVPGGWGLGFQKTTDRLRKTERKGSPDGTSLKSGGWGTGGGRGRTILLGCLIAFPKQTCEKIRYLVRAHRAARFPAPGPWSADHALCKHAVLHEPKRRLNHTSLDAERTGLTAVD